MRTERFWYLTVHFCNKPGRHLQDSCTLACYGPFFLKASRFSYPYAAAGAAVFGARRTKKLKELAKCDLYQLGVLANWVFYSVAYDLAWNVLLCGLVRNQPIELR